MNILAAVDNNYFFPLLVMLTSLFENNKSDKVSIYLIYDQLDDIYIKELRIFVNNSNSRLTLLKIDSNKLNEAPIKKASHFSIAAYYRLLAVEVLPQDLDRILYLDADLIINKDLSKLYHTAFEDKYFIAAEDINLSKNCICQPVKKKTELRIPIKAVYFNTGVLLFNLSRLRDEYDINRVTDYMKKEYTKIKFCDQDVLNSLFWDQLKIIDAEKFNYPAIFYGIKDRFNYFLYRDARLKHIYIIHYISSSKPWKYGYTGKFSGLFWKYAMKTPLRKKAYIAAINFTYQIGFHIYECLKSCLIYGIYRR